MRTANRRRQPDAAARTTLGETSEDQQVRTASSRVELTGSAGRLSRFRALALASSGSVRPTRRRRRHAVVLSVILVVAMILPVPWLHVLGDRPLGLAWRLDGHLEVEGEVIDPPGRWSWLTVGRPKFVFEVLRDAVTGQGGAAARDMRDVVVPAHRPSLAEPAAAVVGLNRAGRSIPLGLRMLARHPVDVRYPNDVVIVAIDGIPIIDRASVAAAAARAGREIRFETADGRIFEAPGPELPYGQVSLVDLAPDEFEAAIYGRLPEIWPITWFRSLALGDSHGLMVALTTYAHTAGHDLAQGRHIAGTGGIRGDGTVSRIGGLRAKADAARDNGADVLLFPSEQEEELVGFDPGELQLVPVSTLDAAIEWLEGPPPR